MSFPTSWRETNVGNVVVDLQPGFAQKPGEEYEGSTPQIRTHNITPHGKISLDGIKHISASEREFERYLLKVGNVVFNNTNSEEWVGKTAVFDQEGEYVFSNHMTRLRVHDELLLPEYLSGYLHLLWSMGYSKSRAKRWVSQAGIESSTLASFKLPLPTLVEQQRIVDLLRQAAVVAKAKQTVSEQVDTLVRTAYWEHFGGWYTDQGLRDPVRISDYVADSQYGVSEAMGGMGSHAVLRMNSLTTSGWLDLSDLKYANLSKKDIESTELRNGDLLFNRTNSRELVGKCGIWRNVNGPFSFASYLIRLRLKDGMLPEYLWATLNSAYGKYRLMNSAKQAVSMANVSPTDLGRITVPLPPLPLQESFAKFIKEVEVLRLQMMAKLNSFAKLQDEVSRQALLGELTIQWRNDHATEIAAAAIARDAFLRERGVKLTKQAEANVSIADVGSSGSLVRPARRWLHGELSSFQCEVLSAFTLYYERTGEALLAEDADVFAGFCDDEVVTEKLNVFGASLNNRIRRALSQLAALGLIAKVSLPKQNLETNAREYLKAFRPLREDEFKRLDDVSTIRRAMPSAIGERKYSLYVHLDYETSERAGLDGKFQVISVESDDGEDLTHLVDQSTHYTSVDKLRHHLASALGVAVMNVELEVV